MVTIVIMEVYGSDEYMNNEYYINVLISYNTLHYIFEIIEVYTRTYLMTVNVLLV